MTSEPFFVAPIVEGHGEVQAVPILLKRIADECVPRVALRVNPPLRVKVSSFVRVDDYFRRHVELAARKAKPWARSCVLILIDCEDERPCKLGPKLLAQARRCRSDVPFLVVLACREYESWFLAAAQSLRGCCGLPPDVMAPDQPHSVRDAKGWLSQRMQAPYNPPDHQPRMTQQFSFTEASTAPSFERCLARLRSLLRTSGH